VRKSRTVKRLNRAIKNNIGGGFMGVLAAIGALTILFILFIVSVYLESTIENHVTDIINGVLKGVFKK